MALQTQQSTSWYGLVSVLEYTEDGSSVPQCLSKAALLECVEDELEWLGEMAEQLAKDVRNG